MKTGRIIAPKWKDYELLDCGNGRKLERFGSVIIDRPEVNATGNPKLSGAEWSQKPQTKFIQKSANSGEWTRELKDWKVTYDIDCKIQFNLGLSQFKHVGIFPEQSTNWEYIIKALQRKNKPKVLNLFAYTGGASLAAKAAGADITHVEAFSQLISKAKENMESSQLENIRWVREDALKFAQKEARRERKYDLVIMDPPTWGRGPKGEVWKLDKHLEDLLKAVSQILKPKAEIIVNTYSGIPPRNLMEKLKNHVQFSKVEAGELIIEASSGAQFVTGSLVRGVYN